MQSADKKHSLSKGMIKFLPCFLLSNSFINVFTDRKRTSRKGSAVK